MDKIFQQLKIADKRIFLRELFLFEEASLAALRHHIIDERDELLAAVGLQEIAVGVKAGRHPRDALFFLDGGKYQRNVPPDAARVMYQHLGKVGIERIIRDIDYQHVDAAAFDKRGGVWSLGGRKQPDGRRELFFKHVVHHPPVDCAAVNNENLVRHSKSASAFGDRAAPYFTTPPLESGSLT
ncbi:hypothetical protein SDC9_120532 [bioreactor metagenome]|uniref:Uncharacterized protein n=1 Tax=bioreactor metagenome TaxID=1076179 RepID=A0A645C731_9ZZZZ